MWSNYFLNRTDRSRSNLALSTQLFPEFPEFPGPTKGSKRPSRAAWVRSVPNFNLGTDCIHFTPFQRQPLAAKKQSKRNSVEKMQCQPRVCLTKPWNILLSYPKSHSHVPVDDKNFSHIPIALMTWQSLRSDHDKTKFSVISLEHHFLYSLCIHFVSASFISFFSFQKEAELRINVWVRSTSSSTEVVRAALLGT